MKKILYITLIALLWGCKTNEMFVYDQTKSSIQFDYQIDKMTLDYDFAFQYKIVKGEWWDEHIYLGDSLRRDTLNLSLSVLGMKSAVDRRFTLKAIALTDQDPATLATVEFLTPYYFRANYLTDTLKVVLVRPAKRGKYSVGIVFDNHTNSDFDLGVAEQSVYRINVTDRYPKPYDWDEAADCLGEYSEEKYAFYVTVLKKILEPWNAYYDNPVLRSALDKYNAAHPEAPKEFTFPTIE